jgi:hypothetical protein
MYMQQWYDLEMPAGACRVVSALVKRIDACSIMVLLCSNLLLVGRPQVVIVSYKIINLRQTADV